MIYKNARLEQERTSLKERQRNNAIEQVKSETREKLNVLKEQFEDICKSVKGQNLESEICLEVPSPLAIQNIIK